MKLDTLYIISIAPKAGKTMFAACLFKMLGNSARKVDYTNPTFSDAAGSAQDEAYMQTLSSTSESGSPNNNILIVEGLLSN